MLIHHGVCGLGYNGCGLGRLWLLGWVLWVEMGMQGIGREGKGAGDNVATVFLSDVTDEIDSKIGMNYFSTGR